MFFCEEKEPRKKAKKTLDESGILAKLPGFRTGHLYRQPGLEKLIQPATEGLRVRPSNEIEPSTEVYFDSSRPVKALGMSIFVKQASGTLRQATANAVFKEGKFIYLSVSHVFFNDDARLRANSPNTCNSGFDLGSDNEDEDKDEDEEQDLNETSRASIVLVDQSPEDLSDSITPQSAFSSPQVSTAVAPVLASGLQGHLVAEIAVEGSDKEQTFADTLENGLLPLLENLQYFGDMTQFSKESDWAVIRVEQSFVAEIIHQPESALPQEDHYWKAELGLEDADVIAHTSRGRLLGRLSHQATYMRLPYSINLRKGYQTILNSALEWGDCGVVITNAETEKTLWPSRCELSDERHCIHYDGSSSLP